MPLGSAAWTIKGLCDVTKNWTRGNRSFSHSQMSILGGHFAVMLIVRVPPSVSREELAERLGAVRDRLGLEAI